MINKPTCAYTVSVTTSQKREIALSATDPRPIVECVDGTWYIAGARCLACGRAVAYQWSACPACAGTLDAALFGPTGVVWSSTVVRIPVAEHVPPYVLAYVDLDDGPRVLARTGDGVSALAIDTVVRLRRPSLAGDLRVEEVRE